jgi:hypothetical protein
MPEAPFEGAGERHALGGSDVLIIGSGHTVQGLLMVAWGRANEMGFGCDRTSESSEPMKK